MSIHQHYHLNATIIIIDDSLVPEDTWRRTLPSTPQLTLIKTPFDIGIAAGRNLAVLMTATEFFVLLDDDFVFLPETGPGIDKTTNII